MAEFHGNDGKRRVEGWWEDVGDAELLPALADDEDDIIAQCLGKFYASELEGTDPSGDIFGT